MAQALPEYACAVLRDHRLWLLLELRPQASLHAGGELTCFGGRREAGEDAEDCLRRELTEELGWQPPDLVPCAELWDGGRFIAAFLAGALQVPLAGLRVLPGHVAVLAPGAALPGLPLSRWHRLVLDALLRGETRVDLARHPGPPHQAG